MAIGSFFKRRSQKRNFTTGRRERVQLITKEEPKSPISEQYRTVRTNIHFSLVDVKKKAIICTSSRPGEGKSTTIFNLAVTFAQQGKRVLLIDADMRKPTAHLAFRLDNLVGMTNVLSKLATLKEAIYENVIPNLSILPSGPIPPNPAELLASRAMEELTDTVKKNYDIILFDTPPVLAVADACILSSLCDGIILVVKSGATEKEDAKKTKELLNQAKANILGVVLNYRKQEDSNYYYYYGK